MILVRMMSRKHLWYLIRVIHFINNLTLKEIQVQTKQTCTLVLLVQTTILTNMTLRHRQMSWAQVKSELINLLIIRINNSKIRLNHNNEFFRLSSKKLLIINYKINLNTDKTNKINSVVQVKVILVKRQNLEEREVFQIWKMSKDNLELKIQIHSLLLQHFLRVFQVIWI